MVRFNLLVAVGMSLLSASAQASPPLAPETIDTIRATLAECTGGWYDTTSEDWRLIGAQDLAPRIDLLARPSTEFDDAMGEDLYAIAKGLLLPAVDPPEWIKDKTASLKCPARPAEAVALMTYLGGEEPDEWRGYVNAFDWLGLVHERGIVGPPDPELARRYYLRSRMHSALLPNDLWSDGIDDDLIANIERAGMRPYLEALAQSERGGGARMILAEEVLASDPAKARQLLRTPYILALNRLLELEEAGRVPTVADEEDIAFWAEAWASLLGYRKWAARMLKGVRLVNGGVVPTSPDRPSADALLPYLNAERVTDAPAMRRPLPVRALVDPQGRAIYVETCRESPIPPGASVANVGVRLDAARLYDLKSLPKLTPPEIDGRPVHGWVILPAVHFQRPEEGKLRIAFANLPPESCAYSDMLDMRAIPRSFSLSDKTVRQAPIARSQS